MVYTIFISGATGNVGKAALATLSAAAHAGDIVVKAATRGAAGSGGDAIRAAGAHAVEVAGDASVADIAAAIGAGVDAVLVIPPGTEQRGTIGAHYVQAAALAGAKRVVALSVTSAGFDGSHANDLFGVQFRETEAAVHALPAGIAWTIVRAPQFLENLLMLAGGIKSQRTIYFAVEAASKQNHVAVADLGAVLATLARGTAGFDGKTLTVSSSTPFSLNDVAAFFGKALGDEIKIVRVPNDAFAEAAENQFGFPHWQAQGFVDLLTAIDDGLFATATADVERVLGRAPLSYEDVLNGLLGAFKN